MRGGCSRPTPPVSDSKEFQHLGRLCPLTNSNRKADPLKKATEGHYKPIDLFQVFIQSDERFNPVQPSTGPPPASVPGVSRRKGHPLHHFCQVTDSTPTFLLLSCVNCLNETSIQKGSPSSAATLPSLIPIYRDSPFAVVIATARVYMCCMAPSAFGNSWEGTSS